MSGRNPLREHSAHSLRSNKIISPESCLLSGIKCKRERSGEMKENMSYNNTERNLKRWKPLSKEFDMECEKPSEITEEVPTKKLRKGDSAKRITAIQFYFEYILRSPEESEWKVNGVVKKIMEALKMPVGSRQTVVTALRASLAGESSSAPLHEE